MVIGGGGGLQQPLLTGARRRYADLYTEGGKTRMFHYLVCTVGPRLMRVDVRMLREDFSGIDRVASFEFNRSSAFPAGDKKNKTPSP